MISRKHTKDKRLRNGSVILWSRRKGEKVPVRCGKCGFERLLYIQNVTAQTFTGLCYKCSRILLRKHTKEEILPSGSVIYWNKRLDLGRNQEIPIKCGICGQVRTLPAHRIPKENFTGICVSCARTGQRSHHWKGGRFKHLSGYILVRLTPEHRFYSMADSHHLVPEHRLIMAEHIGRCLRDNEIVHHKNGIKDDNRLENLELLDRRLHHTGFHAPESSQNNTDHEVIDIIKDLFSMIINPRRRNK